MSKTIKELRAALKAAGFTLKTRKNSEFISPEKAKDHQKFNEAGLAAIGASQ